jgi:hypothetical protein
VPPVKVVEVDAVLAASVELAAARMAERNAAGERVLERHLDAAMITACSPRWNHGSVRAEGSRSNFPLPNWDPLPGGPDLALHEGEQKVALVEQK